MQYRTVDKWEMYHTGDMYTLFVLQLAFLSLVPGCISIVSGQVQIVTSPSDTVYRGQQVTLTCQNLMNNVDAGQAISGRGGYCAMWWQRTKYGGRTVEKESLHHSADMQIQTVYAKEAFPLRTILTIGAITEADEGHYTCTLSCPQGIDTASVKIYIGKDPMHLDVSGSDTSITVLGCVAMAIVACLLMGSVVLASKDNCNCKEKTRDTEEDSSSSEQELSQSPLIHDGSNSPTYTDPPPRYSAVEMPHSPEIGASAALGGLAAITIPDSFSQDGVASRSPGASSTDSVFVISVPPPDYSEAVKELEGKGVIFNPSSLMPMPPSYAELAPVHEDKSEKV